MVIEFKKKISFKLKFFAEKFFSTIVWTFSWYTTVTQSREEKYEIISLNIDCFSMRIFIQLHDPFLFIESSRFFVFKISNKISLSLSLLKFIFES